MRRLPRALCLAAATMLAAASGVAGALTTASVAPAPAYALGNGLALTPPMGFNNWNTTGCGSSFNEALVKGIADTFVSSGLKAAGYQYVNIDDCWAKSTRDASGNLVPDPVRFPNGIKAVADYVHGKGLKFGLYTSAGTMTCSGSGFPGGLGHETADANLFASWGVDYLKYDNCNNQGVDAQQRYTTMRDALAATGRPIVYSICEWGSNSPWNWGPATGNLWRTTGDISDNWASMIGNAHSNAGHASAAGPGAWNDPDMLEVGNGGMTDAEYRTHFSLWAVMAAPMLIGSDIRNASAATLTILKNTDVIAVDQDSLGKQGNIVSTSGSLYVWSRQLSNGDRAVALTNEGTTTATITTSAAAVGLGGYGSYSLKDLWSKAVTTTTSTISASVPAHATVLYRITPVGAPATPPAGTSYLSNLQWTSATNGWGPVEKDKSNGEQAAGDGHTLTVNGTTYAKGLGVHAASEVQYYLGGQCSTVSASVGVDDEVTAGSVVFQLWRDSTKIADSGTRTGADPPVALSGSLSGGGYLRLVMTDAGNGIDFDHGDWGNAQITCGGGSTAAYEAEASSSTLAGAAVLATCAGCSGGQKVGWIGNGTANYVTLTGVQAATAGSKTLTIYYLVDGTRSFSVSVNGGTPQTVACSGTSWTTAASITITVNLNAGANTIKFGNDTAYAPDLDRIVV
ncbi:NPCBM/NEW2 domain-containing protein [Hamadaea tsunoensis]|uniref:NPCBM/NEW2 domain-containing protein n=1 Tax=Hamadaea tsunoensis TaxID=53368 RepID=UPI000405AD56|nr:NPCBM/NEW2 domain-containing protein [Hamadaea tsunoensis]